MEYATVAAFLTLDATVEFLVACDHCERQLTYIFYSSIDTYTPMWLYSAILWLVGFYLDIVLDGSQLTRLFGEDPIFRDVKF